MSDIFSVYRNDQMLFFFFFLKNSIRQNYLFYFGLEHIALGTPCTPLIEAKIIIIISNNTGVYKLLMLSIMCRYCNIAIDIVIRFKKLHDQAQN